MSSLRYPLIQIEDLYLTSDGTGEGALCKCRVENESAFASGFVANSVQSLFLGSVHTQIVERGVSGITFGIVIEYCPETLLASIVALLDAALSSGSTVRVVVTSLTSFDVQAVPQFTQDGALFTYESRSGGIARNVVLRFISTAAGED